MYIHICTHTHIQTSQLLPSDDFGFSTDIDHKQRDKQKYSLSVET